MLTYWFAKPIRYANQAALALLFLVHSVAFAQVDIALARRVRHSRSAETDVIVARKLTEKADASRDAGELVRAYLLYAEAAKCDTATVAYQQKRDAIAGAAKLLIRTKLDVADIDDDVAGAERAAGQEIQNAAHVAEAQNAARRAEEDAARLAETKPITATVAPPALEVLKPSQVEIAPIESTAGQVPLQPGEMELASGAVGSPGLPAAAPETAQPEAAPDLPAPDDTKQEKTNSFHFSYPIQLLGYGTYEAVQKDSPFNPANSLANLPYEDFHAELRPDLKLTYSIFSLSAKPRLAYDRSIQTTNNNVSSYLQEWSARVQATNSLTLSYGREVLMWGPSMSYPASNPFFTNNGRNTPLLEVGARDFGRIIWQPTSHFSLSYIVNTALRRGTTDGLPFQKTAAVKADYVGNSFLVSAIYSGGLSSPFGARKFLGGYAQYTLGQAIRIYVEGSAEQPNPGLFPQTTDGAVGFTQSKLTGGLKPRTIVAGMAYTDVKGGTWTGEYIYNPFGYNSIFASNYFNMAQDLSTSFQQGGVNSRLAAEELASAQNPGNGLLRQNYAFAQYQRTGLGGHFDLVVRYTLSADDRSGQAVAYLTWNASDHIQLFTLFGGMNGSPDTEFARYLRYQAQLGFRIFLH